MFATTTVLLLSVVKSQLLPFPKWILNLFVVVISYLKDVFWSKNIFCVPSITAVFKKNSIVKLLKEGIEFVIVQLSSAPSNTIIPPFAELKVGPFVKVPLLLFPLTSLQVVPLSG